MSTNHKLNIGSRPTGFLKVDTPSPTKTGRDSIPILVRAGYTLPQACVGYVSGMIVSLVPRRAESNITLIITVQSCIAFEKRQ